MRYPARLASLIAALLLLAAFWSPAGAAQIPCTSTQSVSKSLGERLLTQLPSGQLYFRLETFPTLVAAQAAAGPTGVAAEASGKVWLLTLDVQGGAAGGTRVVELGPLTIPQASEYKLRLQQRVSQPGCEGDAHTHPGAEAWYLLAGEQTIVSSTGTRKLVAGQGLVGPAPGAPMQLTYTGTEMTDALTFLALDGAQPASSPATIAPNAAPSAGGGYASGATRRGIDETAVLLAFLSLGGTALLSAALASRRRWMM